MAVEAPTLVPKEILRRFFPLFGGDSNVVEGEFFSAFDRLDRDHFECVVDGAVGVAGVVDIACVGIGEDPDVIADVAGVGDFVLGDIGEADVRAIKAFYHCTYWEILGGHVAGAAAIGSYAGWIGGVAMALVAHGSLKKIIVT